MRRYLGFLQPGSSRAERLDLPSLEQLYNTSMHRTQMNNNNKMNKSNYFLVLDDSDNEAGEEGSSIVPLVTPTDNAIDGTSFVQSSDGSGESKKRKKKKGGKKKVVKSDDAHKDGSKEISSSQENIVHEDTEIQRSLDDDTSVSLLDCSKEIVEEVTILTATHMQNSFMEKTTTTGSSDDNTSNSDSDSDMIVVGGNDSLDDDDSASSSHSIDSNLVNCGYMPSSMLSINGKHVTKEQWTQLTTDTSNKEIAFALRGEGESRYDNAYYSQQSLDFISLDTAVELSSNVSVMKELYRFQRMALVDKMNGNEEFQSLEAIVQSKMSDKESKGAALRTLISRYESMLSRQDKPTEEATHRASADCKSKASSKSKSQSNTKPSPSSTSLGATTSMTCRFLPEYQETDVTVLSLSVEYVVKSAKPKTKTVKVTAEEGVHSAIEAIKHELKREGIKPCDSYCLRITGSDMQDPMTNQDLLNLIPSRNQVSHHPLPRVRLDMLPPTGTQISQHKTASSSMASSIQSENRIRQALEDFFHISAVSRFMHNMNFKLQDQSLILCMMYWAINMLDVFKPKSSLAAGKEAKRIASTKGKTPNNDDFRQGLDCLMSLQRATRALSPRLPKQVVIDAEYVALQLQEAIVEAAAGEDVICKITDQYPDLITSTSYDLSKAHSKTLYPEQTQVMDIIHEKLNSQESCLIGYKVPPSGGKTMLSVAIAAMISKYHRTRSGNPKRLLYICYNNLVRMSVANALEMCQMPFWLASTKKAVGLKAPKSTVVTSYSCRSRGKKSKVDSWKFASMAEKWREAEKATVHFNPIVVSDIMSANILLDMFPDDFVVYFDEPTAGAENGIIDNEIQKINAQICMKLPQISVLLSATLPDITTEMPSLRERFGDSIVMVNSQRLPTSCAAIAPDGSQILPHEMATEWTEFKDIVRSIENDVLMQRFYTPCLVREMSICVNDAVSNLVETSLQVPDDLNFSVQFQNLGALSHSDIRSYAQRLLLWIISIENETIGMIIFERLLKMYHDRTAVDSLKPVQSRTFIRDHVADEIGQALAVTITSADTVQGRKDTRLKGDGDDGDSETESIETLSQLMTAATSDYEMPHLHTLRKQFEAKRLAFAKTKEAMLKNGKKDQVQEGGGCYTQNGGFIEEPEFVWPLRIASSHVSLSEVEEKELDEYTASSLLSGVGMYDPVNGRDLEQTVVMREASKGNLACLFASPDIVYGTNLSLTTVFIGKGYGNIATRNSLYQLIGRAGRTGRAHKAKVIFQDMTTMRKAILPSSLLGTTTPHRNHSSCQQVNFEARVIEWHLQRQAARANMSK